MAPMAARAGRRNLTDAATGSTTGTFNPIQSATGGAGGLTFGPPAGSAGVGGAASSKLRVHDKSAASVIASSSAQGGLGGGTLGGIAGAGGAGRATLHLRSKVATHLEGSVTATGGSGGTDFSTNALAGAGGDATARDAVHAKGGFGFSHRCRVGRHQRHEPRRGEREGSCHRGGDGQARAHSARAARRPVRSQRQRLPLSAAPQAHQPKPALAPGRPRSRLSAQARLYPTRS